MVTLISRYNRGACIGYYYETDKDDYPRIKIVRKDDPTRFVESFLKGETDETIHACPVSWSKERRPAEPEKWCHYSKRDWEIRYDGATPNEASKLLPPKENKFILNPVKRTLKVKTDAITPGN